MKQKLELPDKYESWLEYYVHTLNVIMQHDENYILDPEAKILDMEVCNNVGVVTPTLYLLKDLKANVLDEIYGYLPSTERLYELRGCLIGMDAEHVLPLIDELIKISKKPYWR